MMWNINVNVILLTLHIATTTRPSVAFVHVGKRHHLHSASFSTKRKTSRRTPSPSHLRSGADNSSHPPPPPTATTANAISESQIWTHEHISCITPTIIDSHDVFLLDMWGVMHDGSKPYDGVLDTVRTLKNAGKRMVILSNSSKRLDNSIRMLVKLGFDPDDFDEIITSGEVAHRMLSGDPTLKCTTWPVLTELISQNSRKVFCFGSGDGDEEYCNSSGWTLSPLHEASLILARGTFTINDGSETVISKKDDHVKYDRVLKESLEKAAALGIPMLISNPDKVRPDEGLPPNPGAIGDAYEVALGGGTHAKDIVKRIGKPFREVYDLALCGDTAVDLSRVCMVGDALETDITGGFSVGCSTIWVIKDGIHADAVQESGEEYEEGVLNVLTSFNENREAVNGEIVVPDFVVPHFK